MTNHNLVFLLLRSRALEMEQINRSTINPLSSLINIHPFHSTPKNSYSTCCEQFRAPQRTTLPAEQFRSSFGAVPVHLPNNAAINQQLIIHINVFLFKLLHGRTVEEASEGEEEEEEETLEGIYFFFVTSFLSRNFYLESDTFPVKPSLHLNAETIQKSHIWCGISALTNAWNQRWTCQLQLFLLQSSIFKTRALISKLRLAKLWQLCFDLIEIKRCSNSLQRFVVANGSWSPITRVYKCRNWAASQFN